MDSQDLQFKFQKALDVVARDLATIRTGKASPALVESLIVDAYGTKMKLVELGTIMASDPTNLVITPFDVGNIESIAKAISDANLGLTAMPEDVKIRVAVPGLGTTACLLFKFYLEDRFPGITTDLIPMPFEAVMPAVKKGLAHAGVIIHEGRFVYEHMGFKLIQDLGQWWEDHTGLPIPLGCIAVKKEMPRETAMRVETLIRQSIAHARNFPEAGGAYIRHHAQELNETVIQEHIGLYVNDFSMDLGSEGEKAVLTFFEKARQAGILPPGPPSWFVD